MIISQMAVLFILIAVGYLTGKIKMLTSDGVRTLSKVVINVSTPCTILNSVLSGPGGISGSSVIYFLLLALLSFAIYYVIAVPSARALGDRENRGLYCSMIVFGNVGFMGYPVAGAIFGEQSIFYVALFNAVFLIFSFSVGIVMISGKSGKFDLRLLVNPSLFAAALSLVIVFTGFRAPFIVAESVRLVSGVNTPCAMLVIGASIAQAPIIEVFRWWRLYLITLVKMIVMPLVAWMVFKQFVTDDLFFGIIVVLSGMPIAAVVAMLAVEHERNDRLASGGVFLTTLLSAVTIPLIVYIFLR